jgi:hypothetical protein
MEKILIVVLIAAASILTMGISLSFKENIPSVYAASCKGDFSFNSKGHFNENPHCTPDIGIVKSGPPIRSCNSPNNDRTDEQGNLNYCR